MPLKRLSNIFSKVDENLDIDQRIPKNIKRFKKTISKRDIKNYSRPGCWEKKIEIVTPCFDHAPFIEAAFKSIEAQTRKEPISWTIINDASSDNSLEVIKSIKKNNLSDWIKIKIINNPKNINQSASLNKAIASSMNDLIVILDADDKLTPDCLELIVATYKKHDDIALLGGQSIWFNDDKKMPKHIAKNIDKLKLQKYGPSEAANFTELNSIKLSHSSLSYFKNAWELAGRYRERDERVCSYNDRDFQMRVCSLLSIGIYTDYPTLFYRTGSSKGRGTI